MIRTIKNTIVWIYDFFTSVFTFIVNIFRDLSAMADLMKSAFHAIPSYLTWFPAAFTATLTVLISIAIAYKILGREG